MFKQYIISLGIFSMLCTSAIAEPMPDGVEPLSLDEVREIMIDESVAAHPECPCPYSPDKLGGQCGTNCLYYEPGHEQLKCYMMDISNRDIYFYKLKANARS